MNLSAIALILTLLPQSQAEEVDASEPVRGAVHMEDYLGDQAEYETGDVEISAARLPGGFKNQFAALWNQCGQGCRPVEPWFKGDKRHCKKRGGSCHNSMQAVDIHTITCNDKTYKGDDAKDRQKFNGIVKCISEKGGKTIWQTDGHHNHFHVEMPGCHKKAGCGRKQSSRKR